MTVDYSDSDEDSPLNLSSSREIERAGKAQKRHSWHGLRRRTKCFFKYKHIIIASIGFQVLIIVAITSYELNRGENGAYFPTVPSFSFSGMELEQTCSVMEEKGTNETTRLDNTSTGTPGEIPNLVHYVWILKDPDVLRLNFKMFISVYSTHLYIRPDKIYLHTDATPDVIAQARESGDVWTRRILALSEITINHISAPSHTSKGVKIINMEHKADFLRLDAVREFGGLYMDTDAIPLRDISDLRRAGFANVVGGAVALRIQHTGLLNNGVFLARPNTALLNIWTKASDEAFDGRWETASIHLLTNLANRLMAIPREILILHPSAFAPVSWEYEDQKRLFIPNKLPSSPLTSSVTPSMTAIEQGEPGRLLATCMDAVSWLEEREKAESDREEWEIDFSSTYILHAFDDLAETLPGWDHNIDVGYVLARRSNYARAVYPAIAHAVRSGVIPYEEIVSSRRRASTVALNLGP